MLQVNITGADATKKTALMHGPHSTIRWRCTPAEFDECGSCLRPKNARYSAAETPETRTRNGS
jgi:hypothetical protein